MIFGVPAGLAGWSARSGKTYFTSGTEMLAITILAAVVLLLCWLVFYVTRK